MSDTPTDNPIAASSRTRSGNETIHIESDGTIEQSRVRLSTGQSLGLIQSVAWSFDVRDGLSRAVIETSVTPGDLKVLARNTVLALRPAPSYHPIKYLWDYYATKVWRILNSD